MSSMIKPTKLAFKKAESEWYNFHQTMKEIAELREEITTPFVEDEDDKTVIAGENSVRIPGDPTGRIATRLTTNKQLNYLTEIVDAIERVHEALPDEHKKLVRLKYWSKNKRLTWDGIAIELNVSKRQAMRWRDEVIHTTVEVLGWR